MRTGKKLYKWRENMEAGIELKPCPFCGSKADLNFNIVYKYYEVYCTGKDCNVRFPYFKNRRKNELAKRSAIKTWNNRVGEV
jgi:Lar family restriction alleviation protein